jgi:hypothetical protein
VNHEAFLRTCELARDYGVVVSPGLIPGLADGNLPGIQNWQWDDIQAQVDDGFVALVSHSMTHPRPGHYTDGTSYEREVCGSKQTILDNVILPYENWFGDTQHLVAWIEPSGQADTQVRTMLGNCHYLVSRSTALNQYSWGSWDANYQVYFCGLTTDLWSLSWGNSRFDEAVGRGGIYHFNLHPAIYGWDDDDHLERHLEYIGLRPNIWYVGFGPAYMYHYVQDRVKPTIEVVETAQDRIVTRVYIPIDERVKYGLGYPITYRVWLPDDWPSVQVRAKNERQGHFVTMDRMTDEDLFNGIDACRVSVDEHAVYISRAFPEISGEFFLEIEAHAVWDPNRARNPRPVDGARQVTQDVVFSWWSGDGATGHDVYFGSDFDVVNDADHSSSAYKGSQDVNNEWYEPVGLVEEKGITYYWRIDEVGNSQTYKGEVWSFTTVVEEYAVVDDMESYDRFANKISETWHDGRRNATGSLLTLVGTAGLVHEGEQSMGFCYYNGGGGGLKCYSEIKRTYGGSRQDWAGLGVKALTVYFYGYPFNDATQQMYCGLEDTGGSDTYTEVRYGDYGEDMNDIKIEQWQQWNIDLADFNDGGVDLTDINSIYIGFGDRADPAPGGWGLVLFDDIRLYVPRCVPEFAPAVDLTGDCMVTFRDFAILASQWYQPPGSPSADIAPDPPDGFVDGLDLAALADNWLQKFVWPAE